MKLSAPMIALVALTLSAPGAIAQSKMAQSDTGQTMANSSGGLLRQDNITSTGQTVPHPGESQSAGPTKLDHTLNRENDRIERSICKGC